MLGALLNLFLIFTITLHVYLFSKFFVCMTGARYWGCNGKQTHSPSSCGVYTLVGQMTKINVLAMSPLKIYQGSNLDWREKVKEMTL